MSRDSVFPSKNSEYGTKEYWDSRFKEEEEYEWLTDYLSFRSILLSSLGTISPSQAKVLILGCGNSGLTVEMSDLDGFRDIYSIDISTVVVEKQREKHEEKAWLKWEVMDVTDLKFSDETFDLVIDKSTIDVLLTGESSPWSLSLKADNLIKKTCSGVSRVLKKGGSFLSLSFYQPHFRRPLYGRIEYDWSFEHFIINGESSFHYYFYRMVKGEKNEKLSYENEFYNLKIYEVDQIMTSSDEEDSFTKKFNFFPDEKSCETIA